MDAEAEALEEERRARLEALTEWPAAWKGLAGCVIHVGADGRVAIKAGHIRPEDRAELAQSLAKCSAAGAAAGDAAGSGCQPSAEAGVASHPSAQGSTPRPVHSEKLMRRLTAHRVAALQAELLDRPGVALAALTAHLTLKLLVEPVHGACRVPSLLAISATGNQHELRGAADDIDASEAGQRLEADRTVWIERLPKEPAAVFPWLLAQSAELVQGLLTFLIASTVNGIIGADSERQPNDGLACALGLDMTRWWTATGDAYLRHVSRARVVDVVHEVAGAEVAGTLGAMKKDATVARAEQMLAGRGWLPAGWGTHGARQAAPPEPAGGGSEPATVDRAVAAESTGEAQTCA